MICWCGIGEEDDKNKDVGRPEDYIVSVMSEWNN
jgi:hypothetical protein